MAVELMVSQILEGCQEATGRLFVVAELLMACDTVAP